MASPANSKANTLPETEGHEGANVDKIRDILFGSQMRDYDKRFGRLEDRLIKDAEALRDEMKRRFESLEAFVQKELESLGQRLKAEKSERGESVKDLGVQLRDAAKGIEKAPGRPGRSAEPGAHLAELRALGFLSNQKGTDF